MSDQPVVIERPVPPAPAPPPSDDAALRQYVRDKYGIDDDPETFQLRRKKWQEAEEQLPRYGQALEISRQLLEAYAARGTTSNDAAETTTVTTQVPDLDQRLQRHAKEVEERVAYQMGSTEVMKKAVEQMYALWPETKDQTSDLFRLGQSIFMREMTEVEKLNPLAPLIATERAAGRLGVPPVTRRQAPSPASDDAPAQTVDRGGARRSRGDEEPEVKLSPREQKRAAEMEIDPKVYAKMLAARKAGNANVEIR